MKLGLQVLWQTQWGINVATFTPYQINDVGILQKQKPSRKLTVEHVYDYCTVTDWTCPARWTIPQLSEAISDPMQTNQLLALMFSQCYSHTSHLAAVYNSQMPTRQKHFSESAYLHFIITLPEWVLQPVLFVNLSTLSLNSLEWIKV